MHCVSAKESGVAKMRATPALWYIISVEDAYRWGQKEELTCRFITAFKNYP